MQKSNQVTWRFWYIFAIIALTVLANQHEPMALPYLIPINLLIYYVPVWLVVMLVNRLRRKSPPATVPPPS